MKAASLAGLCNNCNPRRLSPGKTFNGIGVANRQEVASCGARSMPCSSSRHCHSGHFSCSISMGLDTMIRWTGVVLIGFCGMLHPSEIVNLVRKDLVFPKDVAYDMPCMYVHLRNPKTARYARRQHAGSMMISSYPYSKSFSKLLL